MVRWLILFAFSVAGATHAQGSQDPPASADPAASPAAAPALRVSPGLQSDAAQQSYPGLRTSPGLRVHRLPDDAIPAYLEADRMEGDPDSNLTLTGNAEVRRIDAIVKGDRIHYQSGTGDVDVQGSARMLRGGTLVTGPSARFNVDTASGEIESPDFWIGATGGTARADHADIFSRSQMRLTQVTYSGCPCPKPSWYIKAGSVDLDFDENEGVARNGVLYFKDIPILASPYLTFPIKKERKSGFLLPTYGMSTNSGVDISLPYYFNLAPDYDLTLVPRYLGKRGEQLGGEFRYLGRSYFGLLQGTYLANDQETGRNRWMYRYVHRQLLGAGFYTDWDVAKVSDDDYFRDFSSLGLNQASTTYLPQRARVGWGGIYWRTYAQVYTYQTIQDPDAPLVSPYDKLPEFSLKGARYDWGGLDVELDSSAVRFQRPRFNGRRVGQNGDRLQAYPTIAYPMVYPGWYIRPKIGVHYTKYQNTDWPGNVVAYQGNPRDASRTLPIGSIDAGMTFERDTSLFGNASVQTLEPRLYYLRVPYRDQDDLPIYDTALANFSFDQAFQENSYTGGWDRIANANQLTAALTTRWLDAETGFERLSLSAGQVTYFTDQQVGFDADSDAGSNPRSYYLLGAAAALTDTLSTEVAAQYDPYEDNWSRGLVSARWRPQRLTSISLAYRYQRDPLPLDERNFRYRDTRGQNQVSVAFQWPFTRRWYGVGRVDYSLRRVPATVALAEESPRITQAIAGLEYKGDCCWTGRVVFQRYAVSAEEANTAVFFQLELNGLGSLGADPMNLLNESIPGYQPVTPRTPAGTTFERYE